MKRVKINPTVLEESLKSLFDNHQDKQYSILDIIDALHISKKYNAEIKDAINRLIINGTIIKDKTKYQYNPKIKLKTSDKPSPNLIDGIFDATPLARNYSYAFVRTEKGDFYVSSEDTLNAFHGDTLLIEPFYKKGKSDYCYVRKIVKRANETLAGDLQKSKGKYYFLCSNPKIHQWFDVSDVSDAAIGSKVMLKVTNWGNRNLSKPPAGQVVEVLGQAGNPETELLAVIRQNNLPLEFPEWVQAEIEALSEQIDYEVIRKRKDFRNLVTFTIDPSSAKDYDDAISLQTTESGWRLYVHIADVATYIKTDSKLFAECVNRGNSYYFPRKVIPMLPEKLSNKICSLRQNEEKLTMTVVTDFDSFGNKKKQVLYESIINSDARLAYEQVDDLFDDKQTDIPADVVDALMEARKLSQLLTAKRIKAGYLFFDLPETEYLYDEEGFVHQMKQSIETESHKLIENFMLVANQFVAEKLTDISPVVMYRVHELPDMEKLERLSNLLSAYGLALNFKDNINFSIQRLLASFPDETYHRVFDRIVLRSLKKAKYTTEHLPHFGLAIDTYTHFTSPIRRLCDLVIHHLCKEFILKSSDGKLSKKLVANYSTAASEKELLADEAEREIERVMNGIFMKDHLGETFDGIVVGMNSTTLFIQLNKYPITGVLKTIDLPKGRWIYNESAQRLLNEKSGVYFQLMDSVQIQVMQVSDDVYFNLVNESDTHKHYVSGLTPKPTYQKRNSYNRNSKRSSWKNKRK